MKLILDPDRISEYNVVRSAFPGRKVIGTFPDFLVIGPQRTGTTWLHAQLEKHPSICLSFPKELYFFNRQQHPKRRAVSIHLEQFDVRSALSSRQFRRAARDIAKIVYFDLIKTRLLPAYSLEWYLAFFDEPAILQRKKEWKFQRIYGEPYRPIIFGEATASYAALDELVIEDIVNINPRIKCILSIRDPVERAWSHAKKDLMHFRNRSRKRVGEKELRDFFTGQYQMKCASYIEQIDSWKRHLAPGNLLICFYDEIQSAPDEVLMKVFQFLGVNASERYIGDGFRDRVNPTISLEIPPEFRSWMEELFADQRRQLEVEFDRKWPWM